MSGRISPRFPHGQATYYEATCDVCPWTARRSDWGAAEEAQREHEAACRPPLPEVIPDIDFPYPPCPICDGELTHDDGWWCDRCEVLWSSNGSGGEHQPDEPLPATAEGAALLAEVLALAPAVAAGEQAPREGA